MTTIADLSAAELIEAYRRGTLSPVEVARDVLARIEAERRFNAFLPIMPEPVLAAAAASEARWRAKAPLGAVDGLPATIKDNIWLKGEPTRRGSRTGDVTAKAAADAPAVARLREQGAVFIGKTTLPEYGWIGVCHSPLTGITRNPWNAAHTPGGSTGGGAVAALLGLGVLHLGTDGAGSLRIPAAFTGVFGFKPSYGRVPAYPPSPFNVLAHQGPIARRVADAALMLSVDLRARRARHDGVECAGGGFHRRARRRRARIARRLFAAAWRRRQTQRRDRNGGAQGGAGAGRAGCHRRGSRSAAWAARATSSRRCGGRALPRSSIPCRPRSARRWIRGSWRSPNAGGRSTAADYLAAYTRRNELYAAMLGFHQRYDLLLTPTMPVTALKVGEHHAGRQPRRRLDRLVALHLSLQPDAAAGGLGARRPCRQRAADRGADRRAAARRPPGAAGGAGARTGDANAAAEQLINRFK